MQFKEQVPVSLLTTLTAIVFTFWFTFWIQNAMANPNNEAIEASEQAWAQAQNQYYEQLLKLKNPTPEQIANLRQQYLEPHQQNLSKTYQTETEAALKKSSASQATSQAPSQPTSQASASDLGKLSTHSTNSETSLAPIDGSQFSDEIVFKNKKKLSESKNNTPSEKPPAITPVVTPPAEDSNNPTEVIVFKKKTPTLSPQNLDKK